MQIEHFLTEFNFCYLTYNEHEFVKLLFVLAYHWFNPKQTHNSVCAIVIEFQSHFHILTSQELFQILQKYSSENPIMDA